MSSPITAEIEARARRRYHDKSRIFDARPSVENNAASNAVRLVEANTRAPAAKKQHRPRLGFVGVGWIGRHRLEAIAKSEVAEIAAILDPAPELAAQAAQISP